MISAESPLPMIGEMLSAALDHDRQDLAREVVEMERALRACFLPNPEISLDEVIGRCILSARLWSEITGKAWVEDHRAISQYLSQRWKLIFASSGTDFPDQHSRTAP